MTEANPLPTASQEDWTEEDRALAATGDLWKPDGDDNPAATGSRATTNDGRVWDVAPSTVSVDDNREVRISPPDRDGWVTCEPTHPASGKWTPNPMTTVMTVPRDGHDYVAVFRRLTCGAGTVGYRLRYVGPYLHSGGAYSEAFPVEGVY